MKKILILAAISCQFILAQQVKFFRTYGFGIYDSGEGVLQTNDTGYVVGGITSQSGSNGTDMVIYKTDSLGVLEWYKPIGRNNCIDGARSIASGRSKSEFLLAGYQNNYDTSGYNFYVVKTDLNGDTLWTRTYGGSDWDMAYSADTLQDSTYVVVGETYSFGNGNADMYVIRIDGNGDTLWTRTFGGSNDDMARYVFTDRYNNIMVVGNTSSFGAGGSDLYCVYLKPNGDTIMTKVYGTSVDEYGYSGDMFYDNGNHMSFAFAYTQFNPISSVQETRFVRCDSVTMGVIYDINWYFSQPEMFDHPHIRKDGKGRYYMTGDIRYSDAGETDIYLHRTDYGITFSNPNHLDVIVGEFEYPKDIRKCYDNGMIITGNTTSFGPGPTSSFILKTDSLLQSPNVAVVAVEDYEEIDFMVYPNPVTQQLLYVSTAFPIESIKVYDVNGRTLQVEKGLNYTTQSISLNSLSNGMYVVEVLTQNGSGRKKIMVAD